MNEPTDADRELPVNHAEAEELAHLRANNSNLARCYLDLLKSCAPERQELARLRARVKELEEAPLNLPSAVEAKRAVAENEALAKRVATLETAFLRYGHHDKNCAIGYPPCSLPAVCDCGYVETVDALQSQPVQGEKS